MARNRSIFPRAFTSTLECPDIKNTIDCACLQCYVRQILPSRYYKEYDAASPGLASKNIIFNAKVIKLIKCYKVAYLVRFLPIFVSIAGNISIALAHILSVF